MSKNEMIMLPREVVDLALEAVTAAMSGGPYKHRCSDAIDALRKALEQQQNKQEPMRKMYVCNSCQFPYADQPPSQCDCLGDETYTEAWLCTSPKPRRTPLTDECIDAIAESMPGGLDGFLNGWGWRQFARAVLEFAPQPQSDATPYLCYDPHNGDTWTQEAINDGCCPPDGLIALYTK